MLYRNGQNKLDLSDVSTDLFWVTDNYADKGILLLY